MATANGKTAKQRIKELEEANALLAKKVAAQGRALAHVAAAPKLDTDGNSYFAKYMRTLDLIDNQILELMGATIDLKREDANKICISTIDRVIDVLTDLRGKSTEEEPPESVE